MKRTLSLLMLATMLACAPRVPTIQTGPHAEVTHDGLHRVTGTRRIQRAWVKPNLDLQPYSKLLPVNAGIHFRRPPRKASREFPLSEAQQEFIRDGLRTALQEELEHRGKWEFVTEPGPDVLVMRGAIIDLVLTASNDLSARDRSYGPSVGQATFVVELFDSQSLEILARTADRREISRDSTSWRNDPMTNRAAARTSFRAWARRLAAALEHARTFGVPGAGDLEAVAQDPPDAEE